MQEFRERMREAAAAYRQLAPEAMGRIAQHHEELRRRGYTEDDAKSQLTEIGDYLDQAEVEAASEHPNRERLAALMDRVALAGSHPAVALPVLIAFPEVSVWVEGALVAWRLWREGGDPSQVDYA